MSRTLKSAATAESWWLKKSLECVGGIPATYNKDATWDFKYIGFGIRSALFKSGFHVVFWFVVQVFGSWGPLPTDMAWIP